TRLVCTTTDPRRIWLVGEMRQGFDAPHNPGRTQRPTDTYTVRRIPQRAAPGLYPRFAAVAGTSLSVGFVLLPRQELSSALYLASLLMVIAGTGFAICAVLVLGR